MKKIIYQNEHNYKQVSQKFSNLEPQLQYDSKIGNLVKVGQVDRQAEIDSFHEIELHKVLDRFGIEDTVKNCASTVVLGEPGKIYDGRVKDDLSEYSRFLEKTDEIKEKYNLDPYMTVSEVYKFLEQKSKVNAEYIKKGVDDYAKRKEVESKKEQENIQNVGKEDPQTKS